MDCVVEFHTEMRIRIDGLERTWNTSWNSCEKDWLREGFKPFGHGFAVIEHVEFPIPFS